MCRFQEELAPCNAHKSSLRTSSMLAAEHAIWGHRADRIHNKCQKCDTAFSDAEKDRHLNHSGSTEWAGVIAIREPICQKCRESNPEYGYVGQCSDCTCDGCTTTVPRQHCGRGSVMVVNGYGSYVLGCRRHKKGKSLPKPHISGDVRRSECECTKCREIK